MNIFEKILANASDKKDVAPGDIVEAKIDKAMINDITGPLTIQTFERMDGKKVWDPTKIIVICDHQIPADRIQSAELHRSLRLFSNNYNIKYFYDVGRGGVCHQVMMEKGHAKPGELIVGADSHTCTYGAIGAFATGIGSTDMAYVFLTGKLWFKVPKAIHIHVNGELRDFVSPKDLIMSIIGEVGSDGATYMGVKFSGETVGDMSVSGRMTLCNMVVEMGGKAGIIEPDDKTIDYLGYQTKESLEEIFNDEDSHYSEEIDLDASNLEPVISCPPSVDNIKNITELRDVKIDQAFIGSCTNGRLEDLRIAEKILRGKRIMKGVRTLIIPASQEVFTAALEEGLITTFVESGALVCNPNCGPCFGGHMGLLAPGEVCVSTSNRNFIGRMGSREAKVYLGSPATVAASAINGRLTDPRTIEV